MRPPSGRRYKYVKVKCAIAEACPPSTVGGDAKIVLIDKFRNVKEKLLKINSSIYFTTLFGL